jgi:hypothetical protein
MEGGFRQRPEALLAAGFLGLVLLVAWPGVDGSSVAAQASPACNAALVHYRPYKRVPAGLGSLPWVAASPASAGLLGHLFYYDGLNVWKQKRLLRLHIYSGGQSPDGRISMKILWELHRGSAMELRVRGTKLNGSGSFSQQLSPAGSTSLLEFPSIITVPTPGCWRLTLNAGKATGQIVVLAIPGKTM